MIRRVRYGHAMINDLVDQKIATLQGATPDKQEVHITKRDGELLRRLRDLREEAKQIERRFTARHLALPCDLDELPTTLDRTYSWRRAEEKRIDAKMKPLRERIYKLRQQAIVDLMKATTRQESGRIIDAFMRALEGVQK